MKEYKEEGQNKSLHSRPQSHLSLLAGGALVRGTSGSCDTRYDWLDSGTKVFTAVISRQERRCAPSWTDQGGPSKRIT